MRITNLLHFTENHRFYTYRDFSLSPLSYRMLHTVYQPLIGPSAISLFLLLYSQIPSERMGYSPKEQQRRLFLSLGIEPSDKGRRQVIELTSKLEAVGLMQTFREFRRENEEYIYLYHLNEPLNPHQFFQTTHLLLLLRDRIGKHMVLSMREELCGDGEIGKMSPNDTQEELSIPFYELFELSSQVIDYELEQAMTDSIPSVSNEEETAENMIDCHEILRRFPRTSSNRPFVERLKYQPERLIELEYLRRKYDLGISHISSMLDESCAFSKDGTLRYDALEEIAYFYYRQGKKRQDERNVYLKRKEEQNPAISTMRETAASDEVQMSFYVDPPASIANQISVHDYNLMLRKEPYTRFLSFIFPGSIPDSVLNTFAQIDLNYKLKEEVINVLIHYIKANDFSWSRNYVDAIASDMLGRNVDSFEKAVAYIRDQQHARSGKAKHQKRTSKRSTSRKPKLEVYQGDQTSNFSEQDYERALKLAELLDRERD